jgi:hypothetical protein
MMELIDHIGTASGIDDGIYGNTDLGTAQKILSIARYVKRRAIMSQKRGRSASKSEPPLGQM